MHVSQPTCLAEISSDRTLEEDSTLMAVSSSKMLPCTSNAESSKNSLDGAL